MRSIAGRIGPLQELKASGFRGIERGDMALRGEVAGVRLCEPGASFFRRRCMEDQDMLAEGTVCSWDQWSPVPQSHRVLWPPGREGEPLKSWLVRALIPEDAPILPLAPLVTVSKQPVSSCYPEGSF